MESEDDRLLSRTANVDLTVHVNVRLYFCEPQAFFIANVIIKLYFANANISLDSSLLYVHVHSADICIKNGRAKKKL